jgi:hypothetical protein
VQEHYAYRDAMTDVVIRPLGSSHRARIKCGECVKQIAVYENRVAVLSLSSITIYERTRADGQFQVKARILESISCDLLVVMSEHITVCLKQRLRSFDFQGTKCAHTMLPACCEGKHIAEPAW